MRIKNLSIFFLFLILIYAVQAQKLEECRGTIDFDEVPCLVLLPFNTTLTNCNTLTTSFYNNASTLLYTENMHQFNSFLCNATFNQSALGTYTFSYSTGDSGSIIVEAGNLNFFNLSVYLVFSLIAIVFIIFTQIFKDEQGSRIVYGWMATAISVILGSIILSPDFNVINGVILSINADWYLATLSFVLALYTAIVSINIKRSTRVVDTESVF